MSETNLGYDNLGIWLLFARAGHRERGNCQPAIESREQSPPLQARVRNMLAKRGSKRSILPQPRHSYKTRGTLPAGLFVTAGGAARATLFFWTKRNGSIQKARSCYTV